MKRTSQHKELCAMARALGVVGDWWSLLILREALAGVRRFRDFHRNLGAAKNILTLRLRALVDQGVLEAAPASDGSAYREYVPTAKGRALLPVLVALGQWGREHLFARGEPCSVVIDARRGRPLAKLELRAADGRVLAPGEVRMRVDAPTVIAPGSRPSRRRARRPAR